MKKTVAILLVLLTVVMSLTSCGMFGTSQTESTSTEKPKPTEIKINTDGGGMSSNLQIDQDTTFDDIIASIPTKAGYAFAGWYSDEALTDYIIPSHITNTQYKKGTAYAKWIDVSPVDYDIRSNTVTITDSGREKQHMDKIPISQDLDFIDLERAGYSSVKVRISMNIKEVDDGNQYIFIYKDTSCTSNDVSSLTDFYDRYVFGESPSEDPSLLYMYHYEHGAGEKDTSWETITFEVVLNINYLKKDLYLRYGASGKKNDDWCNNSVKVTVTPVK